MAENDNGRKKALIVSVLLFLFFGGGIFLFFIIRGADDLKDDKTKNFSYGSVARSGVESFFKNLGFTDNEPELSSRQKQTGERYFAVEKNADSLLEDWMRPESGGGNAAATASYAHRGAAQLSAGTGAIPRMGIRGSGRDSSSGASSKSSSEFAEFQASGAGKDIRVARQGFTGVKSGAAQKGTLSALNASLGFMREGLRSDSASTAKAKWDASFGAEPSGAAGQAAYSGRLAGLDRIKSGEIASLKNVDRKGLGIPDVGSPVRDKEAEKNDPVLQKAKEVAKDAANPTTGLANSMFSPVANAVGSSVNSDASNGNAQGDNTENSNAAGGETVDKSGEQKMPPGISSFVNDYGAAKSVNYVPGAPSGCQEMGVTCSNGYWKVEYANGTWGSFAMTNDKDDSGNAIPLVFDQCLSATACKK
ncbi:MAG TPA: hypothetical protein DCL44_09340 [Elusimicrobia bacterium]|nr:hypothetical protein [Elusimicrobiota bacterium]